jgi:hypothetical protein
MLAGLRVGTSTASASSAKSLEIQLWRYPAWHRFDLAYQEGESTGGNRRRTFFSGLQERRRGLLGA